MAEELKESSEPTLRPLEELVCAAMSLPDTDTPAVALPGETTLESLERFMDAPRAQRVKFTTLRVPEFLRYVEHEQAGDATTVFVRPNGSGAVGVIDFGTHAKPLWGHHWAVLDMKPSPEFAALAAACQSSLTQRQLIDFLEDWAHALTPKRDSKNLHIANAIQAIRKVDVKASVNRTTEQGDFNASVSSFEAIDARAADGQLPGEVVLKAPVYPDTTEREISARLSLRTSDDTPRFMLRISGEDALRQAVAEEVEQLIRDGLNGVVRVFVGQIG